MDGGGVGRASAGLFHNGRKTFSDTSNGDFPLSLVTDRIIGRSRNISLLAGALVVRRVALPLIGVVSVVA